MTTTRPHLERPPGLDLPDSLLVDTAEEVRRRMLACCALSGVGHVGGCAGAVEILSALYFGGILRYDPGSPSHPSRDRLLLRGHLGPTRYAIFNLLGWLDTSDLPSYATLGSLLEGHETTALPGVDIGPSGSLGMIVSQGVGAAMAATSGGWRTFVVLGDGEEQEGNVAEAARDASAAGVRDIVVILDLNGRQLSGPTASADAADIGALWRSYGWRVVDLPAGNDVLAARDVLRRAAEIARHGPVAVMAHTTKGHGLTGAARHFSGYHELAHCPDGLVEAEPIDDEGHVRAELRAAIEADQVGLPPAGPFTVDPTIRRPVPEVAEAWARMSPDDFQLAFLSALADMWRGNARHLYFLYADTFPEPLLERTGLASAARCRNVGIREQHLVALAHGLSVSDPGAVVVVHTGDAFVLRALDQLNAAAIGGGRFLLLADDAGITNCRNGVSHQSALTSRIVATLPEVTVVEPADGVDFGLAAGAALLHDGITYLRVHDALLRHPIGVALESRSTRWYPVRKADGGRPDAAVLATGFAVGEAIGAAEALKVEGPDVAVVNVLQPARAAEAAESLACAGVPVVTVYDGDPETLAGPMRRAAAPFGPERLRALGYQRGRSGRLEELVAWAGIDTVSVAGAARELAAARVLAAEASR